MRLYIDDRPRIFGGSMISVSLMYFIVNRAPVTESTGLAIPRGDTARRRVAAPSRQFITESAISPPLIGSLRRYVTDTASAVGDADANEDLSPQQYDRIIARRR